jgi:hypothetical protein
MLILDAATRAYLLEKNALGTDPAGREVLRGLTFEETEEYLSASCTGRRKIVLSNKHERERIKVLSAAADAKPEVTRKGASD